MMVPKTHTHFAGFPVEIQILALLGAQEAFGHGGFSALPRTRDESHLPSEVFAETRPGKPSLNHECELSLP